MSFFHPHVLTALLKVPISNLHVSSNMQPVKQLIVYRIKHDVVVLSNVPFFVFYHLAVQVKYM